MANNVKILYLANIRLPTEKAHGFQIAKMCEQFAVAGADVELRAPRRRTPITEDISSYYGVRRNFRVVYVDCMDFNRLLGYMGRPGFYLNNLAFVYAMRRVPVDRDAIIYTRDPFMVFWYGRKGYKTVYDAHNFPENHSGLFVRMVKCANKIVCNSPGTTAEFTKRGFKNVLTVHNGVDLSKFATAPDNGHSDTKLITYVGHLYPWKGIDTVMEAASLMKSDSSARFQIIGGTESDIAKYRGRAESESLSNISFIGHKRQSEIPAFLMSSDILLLPNVPISKESESYTSPIKMFEYMASGVPIIASDMPSIRSVLTDDTALFFKAGNAASLVSAIRFVLGNGVVASVKAGKASEEARKYSWESRAEKILKFISE